MKETDQIKEKLDIVELIAEYVTLKKAGRNFKANCPFHGEKTPSFVVSPDKQIWHCFGACNEGGDIFKFFMKAENVDFPQALTELGKRAGITLRQTEGQDPQWNTKKRLLEINHLTSEYYHFLLTKHTVGEPARAYLTKRNISDKLMKTFLLGYAPSGWRNLLPFLKKKGYKEDEIIQAGLAISTGNTVYDRFRGRIMFTLFDHRNNIVGFSGRILTGEKEVKYVNTPETPLYHKSQTLFGLNVTKDAIRRANQAIICEGEFDVLSSYQAGISNVVAIKGTAFTLDQLKLLKRFTDELILALDMDIAGDAAARRCIELAEQFEFHVKLLKLPMGKDLDEAIQINSGATKQAIQQSVSVYDFILDSSIARHGKNGPYTKKKIADEVIPFYVKIENPIVRNVYIKRLASALSVSEDAVEQMFSTEQKRRSIGRTTPESTQKNKIMRVEQLDQHLLSLIIQGPTPRLHLQTALQTLTIQDIQTTPVRRILSVLEQMRPEEQIKLELHLPSELRDTYNRAYLVDIGSVLKEKKDFDQELIRTIIGVKKAAIKNKLTSLSAKVKSDELLELHNNEFQELQKQLRQLEKKTL